MLRYTLLRIVGAIPTLLLVIALAFMMVHAAPGGPFDNERVVSAEIEANIAARLEEKTGAKVMITERIDESLIAGFQARVGGAFYDGSLRGRLERIKETITHGE